MPLHFPHHLINEVQNSCFEKFSERNWKIWSWNKLSNAVVLLMQWWWFHCIQTPKRISSTTIMLSSLTYQTIKIFRTIKSMTIIRNSFTFLSAMYNASANFANLSFICGSWRPRPSAAKRLSRGIVYPYKQQQNNFKTNISWNEKLFQECNQLTKNKNPTEKFTKLSCEQVFFFFYQWLLPLRSSSWKYREEFSTLAAP